MLKNKGYTMIELLAVITIIMILSAAALSGLTNIIGNLRFGNTFNKIILMVQQARNLAISNKNTSVNNYIVQFNMAAPSKFFSFANKNLSMAYDETTDENIDGMSLAAIPNLVISGTSTLTPPPCSTSMVIAFRNGNGEVSLSCDDRIEPYSLQVGLKDTNRGSRKTFLIHKLAGIPQVE